MDMSEDEAPAEADEVDDDDAAKDNSSAPAEEEHKSDEEHEREDSAEIEAARKERMALMAAEGKDKATASGGKGGEQAEGAKVDPNEKFQYLMGQSEVFAHFLAGE